MLHSFCSNSLTGPIPECRIVSNVFNFFILRFNFAFPAFQLVATPGHSAAIIQNGSGRQDAENAYRLITQAYPETILRISSVIWNLIVHLNT